MVELLISFVLHSQASFLSAVELLSSSTVSGAVRPGAAPSPLLPVCAYSDTPSADGALCSAPDSACSSASVEHRGLVSKLLPHNYFTGHYYLLFIISLLCFCFTIHLSIHISTKPSIYLSFYLSIHPSIHLYISVPLFLYLPCHQLIHPSTHPHIHPYIYP